LQTVGLEVLLTEIDSKRENLITTLAKKLYWSLPPNVFCAAFNLRRIWLRSPIRLTPHSDRRIFKIFDGDCGLAWHSHRDRLTLYSEGLVFRANQIADAYGLKDLELNNGDLVIDCGANLGDLQLYLKLIKNVEIIYVAFEPSRLDFLCLDNNRLFPGNIYNFALFNSNSMIDFYIDIAGANSSAIEPPSFTDKVKVKSVRLDSFIFDQKIALFKVEAEGAEPEVLEGSSGIIHLIKYLCIDAGPERGVNKEFTLGDVEAFCIAHNFQAIGKQSGYRRAFLNRSWK